MKMTTFTYGLECYLHMFSPERQAEIERVANNWETIELKDGRKVKNMLINPETGVLALCDDDGKIANHATDYYAKKVVEKYLTPEELALCDDRAVEIHRANREKIRFDNAKKIPVNEYDMPVFEDDHFYMCIDDLYDHYACYHSDDPEDEDYWEDALPEYVYGSIKVKTMDYDDIHRMVDNNFEQNVSDLEDSDGMYAEVPEYLQEAWNRFVDEYGKEFYEADDKTVILLK